MTHVVTSACVDHKYQECVAVCPVEAFREADTYLIIDPDECIDCGACVPECPIEAIFFDEDVPLEQLDFIKINEDLSKHTPLITTAKAPHSEKDLYVNVTGKKHLI